MPTVLCCHSAVTETSAHPVSNGSLKERLHDPPPTQKRPCMGWAAAHSPETVAAMSVGGQSRHFDRALRECKHRGRQIDPHRDWVQRGLTPATASRRALASARPSSARVAGRISDSAQSGLPKRRLVLRPGSASAGGCYGPCSNPLIWSPPVRRQQPAHRSEEGRPSGASRNWHSKPRAGNDRIRAVAKQRLRDKHYRPGNRQFCASDREVEAFSDRPILRGPQDQRKCVQ